MPNPYVKHVIQEEKLTPLEKPKLPYNPKQESILMEFSPCPAVCGSYSIINKDRLRGK